MTIKRLMVRFGGFLVAALILALPFVVAAPPFSEPESGGGLLVQAPKFLYQQQYREFRLHSHVFNSTGYLVTNTTVNCTAHVYNSTNRHVVKQLMTFDGVDFEATVLLNTTGEHSFTIYCLQPSTGNGGYASAEFMVTTTGRDDQHSDLTPLAAAILGLYLVALFFGIGGLQFKESEEHRVFSYALFLLGCVFALVASGLVVYFSGVLYSAFAIDATLATIARAFSLVLIGVFFYWVFYVFYALYVYRKNKREGNL